MSLDVVFTGQGRLRVSGSLVHSKGMRASKGAQASNEHGTRPFRMNCYNEIMVRPNR